MRIDPGIVLDTNVFISAILRRRSTPAKVFDLALDHLIPLVSWKVLNEYVSRLDRPKFDRYVSKETRLAHVQTFLRGAIAIEPEEEITACRDPDDDKFLSLAVAGDAALIVSGDRALLDLHPFRGVEILEARDALDWLAGRGIR